MITNSEGESMHSQFKRKPETKNTTVKPKTKPSQPSNNNKKPQGDKEPLLATVETTSGKVSFFYGFED